MDRITPENDLKKELLKVNLPGRYVGGEYGSIIKTNADLSIALCFPDLYEIGMSNQAVKILYEMINTETDAACERVFSPAPDFEKILREKDIPLYTFETGRLVATHDILAFTIGYELSATNILNVLELSGIALFNIDRDENDPVVIAGGPAITNPVPFGSFIDAVYIGEAEGIFKELTIEMCRIKRKGAKRSEILELLKESEYFWCKDKKDKVKKAVWNGFGIEKKGKKLLVPSINAVQDHGVVEIMRGCPNGCRFCHAGIFYRPYREKSITNILEEVDLIITKCGYREITLSSLSSGDYRYIRELITILNGRYSSKKISFSFPSIRVNSFTLPLISEISKVRKSGLTFAIETPDIIHQRGLNKEVPLDRVVEIMKEAKKLGWNKAKFYFMLGLPFFENEDETDAIIDFLRVVGRESKMQINVNIGTFIPKPHTPFQWAFQLNEKRAYDKIMKIKRALPERFFKVGFQSPFMSFLEGIISRGDEKAGELIIEAFKKGARLDAWTEYFNKDVWTETISKAEWEVEKETCSTTDINSVLPWDDISLNAGKNFLKDEWTKTFKGQLTSVCESECHHQCGACNEENKIKINEEEIDIEKYIKDYQVKDRYERKEKIIFSFSKKGKASFISHINIMNVFERAFLRAGIDLKYSEGFNPKPKLEFANPLTLGFESEDEIASIEILTDIDFKNEEIEQHFIESLNPALPEGLQINKAKIINTIASNETGKKVKSLMASYNGGKYSVKCFNKESLEKIRKLFSDYDGVDSVVADLEENILSVITYKNKDGKILNFFKFLTEKVGYEHPFDYVDVYRHETYCLVDDASISKEKLKEKNYFECYK